MTRDVNRRSCRWPLLTEASVAEVSFDVFLQGWSSASCYGGNRAAPSAWLVPHSTFTSLWCIYLKQSGIFSFFFFPQDISRFLIPLNKDLFCVAACDWRRQAFISCPLRYIPDHDSVFSKVCESERGIRRPDLRVSEWVETLGFHQLVGGWLGSALPEWSSSALSQSESSYWPWCGAKTWIIWVRTATDSLTLILMKYCHGPHLSICQLYLHVSILYIWLPFCHFLFTCPFFCLPHNYGHLKWGGSWLVVE